MAYKYLFFSDYSEGCHPRILECLSRTNLSQEIGYGEDTISLEAAKLLKEKIRIQNVDIHFVSGGTQANLISLASMLRPYESIISADTGHINTHEAGAVEATGHKIDSFRNPEGKVTPETIQCLVVEHRDEHMVKPRVVFISQPTEVGTIYLKKELEALSQVCKESNLYLFLDGARLGSALTAKDADLDLKTIASLVDLFYIGGTKNGALLGEAIVVVNDALKPEFRRHLKQRGALLAKGRVLGSQFLELFRNNLYFDLASHANAMAGKLSRGIKDLDFGFLTDSRTNQIFPILPNDLIEKLNKLYGFYVWSKIDDSHSSIRLVTSWATREEAVDEFLSDLRRLK